MSTNEARSSASSGRVHIGDHVLRREDVRFTTGRGRYIDDIELDRPATHAVFVRSPHPHARIRSIDAGAAKAMRGVLMVLLPDDASDLPPLPHLPTGIGSNGIDVALVDRPGTTRFHSKHFVMPHERVHFVGEIVAMVVADTLDAAKDAAETISVDYEPLPSVAHSVTAIEDNTRRVWDDNSSNVAIDAELGDRAATDAAFRDAAHVAQVRTWAHRVTGVHMEPRAAIADYNARSGQLTLYAASGRGPVHLRSDLASVLGIEREKLRILHWDIGGSFGTRNCLYPDFVLLCVAARKLGRPVKNVTERQEAFASDYQARDLHVDAKLALDARGKFIGLQSDNLSNIGAYTISFAPLNKGVQLATAGYVIPSAYVRGRAVFTNTTPTIPYRSAGRPEVIYVMERLIDLAAKQSGIDRVELRRRNLVRKDSFPHRNGLGLTYDSGDYASAMDKALRLSDWAGFKARRKEARRRGKRRGIGIANYVEATSGAPRERSELSVRPDGIVEMTLGTFASGQGHETAFPQLVSDWLGVALESIHYFAHDTDLIEAGGGSHSGRSMRIASIAVREAADAVIARGKALAAYALNRDDAAIAFRDGQFSADGEQPLNLFELARLAESKDLPQQLQGPLRGVGDHTVRVGGFPFGCHVCEVEVDTDTGAVEIVRYTAIDDVGKAINPMILHGQTHGGIAQGVGQAMWEQCVYDPTSGQLLSGSLMDYALPRAADLPSFDCELSEVPATSHPLGIRPGGEGGCTPALGATMNAIVDALSEFGVTHIEMPATPERVWRAIRDAKR
jgi:aerobic carbon-monoxide dehydrogenase large subunit